MLFLDGFILQIMYIYCIDCFGIFIFILSFFHVDIILKAILKENIQKNSVVFCKYKPLYNLVSNRYFKHLQW